MKNMNPIKIIIKEKNFRGNRKFNTRDKKNKKKIPYNRSKL